MAAVIGMVVRGAGGIITAVMMILIVAVAVSVPLAGMLMRAKAGDAHSRPTVRAAAQAAP